MTHVLDIKTARLKRNADDHMRRARVLVSAGEIWPAWRAAAKGGVLVACYAWRKWRRSQ